MLLFSTFCNHKINLFFKIISMCLITKWYKCFFYVDTIMNLLLWKIWKMTNSYEFYEFITWFEDKFNLIGLTPSLIIKYEVSIVYLSASIVDRKGDRLGRRFFWDDGSISMRSGRRCAEVSGRFLERNPCRRW